MAGTATLKKPKEAAKRQPQAIVARPAANATRPRDPARSSLLPAGAKRSSGVVEINSATFAPSQAVADEIAAAGHKGLDVRIIAKGLTEEGNIKVRQDSKQKFDSIGNGSMLLLNPWTQKLGGMHLVFGIANSAIKEGYASFKPKGGGRNEWLQILKQDPTLLGGLGLKIESLPKPVNKFEAGKLVLGVTGAKVHVGGYVDAKFDLLLENMATPKVTGSAAIDIKGAVKGELTFDNMGDQLKGSIALAVTFKSFSGNVNVIYKPDGTVDISGKAAYSADKLSGEIQFVATDLDAANKFAKDAIAAAGGPENVQNAAAPAPVPVAKEGQKKRALAAVGILNFNLTNWFAGTVNVVVDGKGAITVIGKIAPPGEITLFKQRDWDKEIVKLEAKAYYGIPVVGNLNLFANISLYAIAKLGPAKLYNIEILGTYSTDPEIQKSIQISGSINISAYGGLRLRAEGGAGITLLKHDLKFGIGLNADVGVKAYADARPTIGYRDPGIFYVSGTLDLVAQPMLGLSGEFFIELDAPWFSPLDDDRWSWPLFSKEWPLGEPIGISASVKDYVLGSGAVPEITMKPPEFDPSKFMTNMVDDKLPDKAGGKGASSGSFKEDGSVQKPVVPPKKPVPKAAPAKPGKKGKSAAKSKSATPDTKAANSAKYTEALEAASKPLAALKGKAAMTRGELDKELAKIKAQVSAINFDVKERGAKWLVTPKAGVKVTKGKTKVTTVELARNANSKIEWWRTHKPFRDRAGASHDIHFRGEGANAILVMASVEKPISQHLADVVAFKDADAATKARANAARDFSIKILEPVKNAGTTPTKAQLEAMKALGAKLDEFKGMLLVIVSPDNGTMPDAQFIFNAPHRATAEKISNRTSRGGEDSRSGDPLGWTEITDAGLTRRNGNWVRMHLISAAFGGLDVNANLVPAPTAINTAANSGLEQRVERILYGKNRAEDVRDRPALLPVLANRRGLLWVEATTSGFHPAAPATAPAPAIPANAFIRGITIKFGRYDKKGQDWVRNPAVVETYKSPAIGAPVFTGKFAPNLNQVGWVDIKRVGKITEYMAKEVVRVRKEFGGFGSPNGFVARMNSSRVGTVPEGSAFDVAVGKVKAKIDAGKFVLS